MTTRTSTALGLSLAAGALLLPAQQGQAGESAGARIELAQAQPAPQQPDPKQKAQAAEAERRAKAEAARQQAERARQQADQVRQQAERARQQAAEQARQQQEAQRKARQDQQRKDDEARRAKADQDRARIQAERERAQSDRRKEDEARRAKADQERLKAQAERDKAQTERRKEEEARRLKADQEHQKVQAEREKAQADRRREDEARRAKAEQERLRAQDERKKADDLRAGVKSTVPADTGRRDGAPAGGLTAAQPGPARAPGAPPTSNFVGKGVPIRDNLKLQDIKSQRQERREGNTTIIREPGGRQIVRENNRAVIVNSDVNRLRLNARDVQTRSGAGGTRITSVVKPNGFTVITTEDAHGRVLRRSRRDPSGREHVFFQNRSRPSGWTIAAVAVAVAIPAILISRHLYEVDAREARYDDYYTAFRAEPVSRLDRVYSLDEVRYNYSLRAHMRSVDVNTITFQSGSWDIDPSQFRKLDDIARAIDDVLRDNPDEVFLIEGHTDAVGNSEDNLTLSDRRAESVARVLSEEFGIPPENLTTQGYGEEFLKVPTEGPEARNRRVVIRRITPLVSENYRR